MSLMDKLKSLFQRADLPEETRQLYNDAQTPRELVKGLETLRGRNEIDLRESEQQLIALEKAVMAEEDSIRKGGLTRTEETIALRRIERLEKQRANLDKQVSIYNGNVTLHLDLVAKIQEMEAMRSRGIGEDAIDRLADDMEDSVKEYKRVNIAAESGSRISSAIDESAERHRLDEIKRRIMGGPEKTAAEPEEEIQPPKPALE